MKILINVLIKLILNIDSFFPISISSLEELADDEYWEVRCYVARNPKCPLKLLEKLADDKSRFVRSYVAKHPNCPQYLKDYIIMKKFVRTYGTNS